jgi:predicted dehydrogenase
MSSDKLGRRSFVAGLAAAPTLMSPSPNETVRVAVIGVGNRGSFLLKNIVKVPGVQVIAISDLDAARIKAAQDVAPGAAGFEDYRKMLDTRKDIDVVIIATPVDTHKGIALAALEVGKHVYCEKPMSTNVADTRLMLNAAKSAKGIFQAGFQLRHDPQRRASIEFIQKGGIGKVLFAQGYRNTGDLPRETLWLFDRERSGDNIVEQACHILDLFVWAIGKPPLRAMGSGGVSLYKNVPPGRTTMDNYSLIYEFPDDVRVSFTHLYFDPPGFSGTKERIFGASGAVDLATATWMALDNKAQQKLQVADAGQDSTYLSLAAFIDNARGKKTPLNNAESAARSTMVAILGRTAIHEKRIVTWDEIAKA